eukprot:304534_1
MKDLGDQRYQTVNDHVIETEREAKRVSYYREYCSVADAHQKRLDACLAQTDAALKAYQVIEDALLKSGAKLDPAKLDEELGDMKLDEQQFYLKIFRRFWLTTGDLVDKKEKRLNGVNKMHRGLEFQLKIAKESLDPESEKYRVQELDLSRRRDDLVGTIQHLRQSMDKEYDYFKGIEEMLEENEIDFKDPTVELQEFAIDKKARFLNLQKDFVSAEQNDVENDAVNLRKLDQQKRM